MQIRRRRISEFLAEQTTIALLSKFIGGAAETANREACWRAGFEHADRHRKHENVACQESLRSGLATSGRARRALVSGVLAAALLLPSLAHAAPIFTAEGTAAFAALWGWLWWACTHGIAFLLGVILMACFGAAGRADREMEDDANARAWLDRNARELGE